MKYAVGMVSQKNLRKEDREAFDILIDACRSYAAA